MNRFLLSLMLLPVLGFGQPSLPTCENCLDSLLHVFWNKELQTQYDKEEKLSSSYTINFDEPTKGILFVGNGDLLKVTIQNQDNGNLHSLNLGRASKTSELKETYARFFTPISFSEGTYIVNLTSKSYAHLPYLHTLHFIKNGNYYELEGKLLHNAKTNTIFTWIFLLTASLFLLFAIANFLFYKNPYFKYYQFYVLVIFLMALFHADFYSQKMFLLRENVPVYGYVLIFLQQILFATYNQFFIDFLDVKNKDLFSYRLIKVEQLMHLALAVVLPTSLYVLKDYDWIIKHIGILNLSTAILGFWALGRVLIFLKNPLRFYLAMGTLFIAGASVFELLFTRSVGANFSRDFYSPTWNGLIGFNIFQLGAMLDMALFFLAINHKTANAESEKNKYQKRVVSQLQENEKLQQAVNSLLQKEVTLQKAITAQEKESREKIETESKLRLAQLKSIQLQMNPHYFFNSLNSVNDIMMSRSPREASEYLAKYAKLMRSVLKNSEGAYTSIEEEIKHLKIYLELEAIRFNNKFDYHFETSERENFLQSSIPIMLIQPLLENAVWHGMQGINYQGKIWIRFKDEYGSLVIEVEDNGKGLSATQKEKLHSSKGLKMIQEKLQVINSLHGHKITFEITNKGGKSTGVLAKYVFK